KGGILCDHRLCFENLLRCAAGGFCALLQIGRNRCDGVTGAAALGVSADRAGGVLWCRKRLCHADDRALRDTPPDADSAHLGHQAESWSWSVVISSVSVSSTPSA